MDELIFKATVTGKRQITIPKEVCKILNIQQGNQVAFRQENNNIIFEVAKEQEKCFVCNGIGMLDKNKCFICNGTGKLNKEYLDDIYKFMGFISLNSIKFNVTLKFQDKEEGIKIFLLSDDYDENILNLIEKKLNTMIRKI